MRREFCINISESKADLLESTIKAIEKQAIFDQFTEYEQELYLDETDKIDQIMTDGENVNLDDAPANIDCSITEWLNQYYGYVSWEKARYEN